MNKKYLIGNAILWASAIIASTLVHAPVILSRIIWPALAVCSVVVIAPQACSEMKLRHCPLESKR